MPEIVKSWIGSIVRTAITTASTYLISKKILTPDQANGMLDSMTLAISGFIAAFLWSLWQKYRSKLRFFTALELPANASTATVDEVVQETPASDNRTKAFQ